MRPADFFIYLDACNEQQNEEFKRHAELIRRQTAILLNIQLEADKRLSEHELWPFEWDIETEKQNTETDELTQEQIEAHNLRLAAKL